MGQKSEIKLTKGKLKSFDLIDWFQMNDIKHSNVCLNKTHELHALRIRIGSIFLRTKLGQKYI